MSQLVDSESFGKDSLLSLGRTWTLRGRTWLGGRPLTDANLMSGLFSARAISCALLNSWRWLAGSRRQSFLPFTDRPGECSLASLQFLHSPRLVCDPSWIHLFVFWLNCQRMHSAWESDKGESQSLSSAGWQQWILHRERRAREVNKLGHQRDSFLLLPTGAVLSDGYGFVFVFALHLSLAVSKCNNIFSLTNSQTHCW